MTQPWQQVSNILAVRLDGMGDVLMTTPALAALTGAPERQVTLLTSRAGAALADHVPGLAGLMVYQAPWLAGDSRSGQGDRRFLSKLAHRHFDAAVIFTGHADTALPAALLCRMAAIPLRLAHSRDNPHQLLTDWVPDHDVCAPGMRHEVQRQLDLVATVGFHGAGDSLTFRCLPVDQESMRLKLALAAASVGRPTVVVHPGVGAASSGEPAERVGAAARRIAEACGAQIVFVGGEADAEACAVAQAAMDGVTSFSLAGRLSFGELGALIADARLLVCGDGGPAHIAAAVGTPVVVLAAPTQHTPWRVPSRVLNHEARWHEVSDAALDLWREAEPAQEPGPETRQEAQHEVQQQEAHLELHTA